jgi:hypothetical protein
MGSVRSNAQLVLITALLTYAVSYFQFHSNCALWFVSVPSLAGTGGSGSDDAAGPVRLSPVAVSAIGGAAATTTQAMLRTDEISFAVLTSAKHHNTRLRDLFRSWGSRASIRIVATDNATDVEAASIPSLTVFPYHGRTLLGRKAMAIWARFCTDESFVTPLGAGSATSSSASTGAAQLNATNSASSVEEAGKVTGAKWFVMVDDDTFVAIHNLRWALSALDPLQPIYAGYVLTHMPHKPIVGGGGGIVLSRAALQGICAANKLTRSRCHPEGVISQAGDTATRSCVVDELGIRPTHIEGFLPVGVKAMMNASYCKAIWWWPEHIPCRPPSRVVTFHYVRRDEMLLADYWANTFASAHAVAEFDDAPRILTAFTKTSSREAAKRFEAAILKRNRRMTGGKRPPLAARNRTLPDASQRGASPSPPNGS